MILKREPGAPNKPPGHYMTEPVETELVARLREFVVSDELGNSDFSVCDEAADEIEHLQAELREACHERDGFHAERDMARERLEWSPDQPYDGIAARDETIAGLQAELARVRKLGEAMADALSEVMGPLKVCHDNPNVRDDQTLPVDFTMGELRMSRAALAAWNAEAGR